MRTDLAIEKLLLDEAPLFAAVPSPVAAHAPHKVLRARTTQQHVPHHLKQALGYHTRLWRHTSKWSS